VPTSRRAAIAAARSGSRLHTDPASPNRVSFARCDDSNNAQWPIVVLPEHGGHLPGGAHGAVELLPVGRRATGKHFARGRIDDFERGIAVNPLAIYQVRPFHIYSQAIHISIQYLVRLSLARGSRDCVWLRASLR